MNTCDILDTKFLHFNKMKKWSQKRYEGAKAKLRIHVEAIGKKIKFKGTGRMRKRKREVEE